MKAWAPNGRAPGPHGRSTPGASSSLSSVRGFSSRRCSSCQPRNCHGLRQLWERHAEPREGPASAVASTSGRSAWVCHRSSAKRGRLGACLATAAPQQAAAEAPSQLQAPLLPGVDSPAALRSYWAQAVRPRLESLYRAASAASARPVLLPLLDELLWELNQVGLQRWWGNLRDSSACHMLKDSSHDRPGRQSV